MILPVDVTLEQLRSWTKEQIITRLATWLTNNWTKRQIIIWLLEIDIVADTPITTYYSDGQVKSGSVIYRDAETSLQVIRLYATYTYYPTSEVDTITIQEYNADDMLTKTVVIKHFTDGRQPVKTEV